MTVLFRALSTVLLLTSACAAVNVKDHLVRVERWTFHLSFPPQARQVRASGICIDQRCSVIASPYHVQALVGRAHLGVVGGHTKKVLSLANESDANKTDIPLTKEVGGKKTVTYDVASDISFVYTKKPVSHKSGVLYSYKCYVGQYVEIAGYNNRKFEKKDAHIIGVNVPLTIGRAQLPDNLILDVTLDPGASGSAVFDEQGKLLGMITMTGILKLKNGDLKTSIALPVRTIAKALVRLDPALGSAIFKDLPEAEPSLPQMQAVIYQDDDLPADTSPVIPELSSVSVEVQNPVERLRTKSEAASRRMVDFIAKQCLVQGTQKPLCHELAVVDGEQTFRQIEKSGKLGSPTGVFPVQKHGVWTQSDWNDTLGEIADNSWEFQGSVDNHYLFTFRSSAEDDRCFYEEHPQGVPLFGGGRPVWKGSLACFQQVLTDKDFNVLAVFSEMIPPDNCLAQLVQTAIYYDWVKLEDLQSPILLPVKERITAKVQGQKQLWYANVSWTEYRQFRVGHTIYLPPVNRTP